MRGGQSSPPAPIFKSVTHDHSRTLVLLQKIGERFALAPLLAKTRDIGEYCAETDHVDIVVLGRFKRTPASPAN
jgi:hypothetical protein